MSNPNIRNIVFDLGDVILNIDIPRTVAAFAQLAGCTPVQIQDIFQQTELFRKFETGNLDEAGFRNLVRQAIALPDLTDIQIDTAWNELLLDIPVARIDLLKNLATRYNLYLLSNTSSIHITRVNQILEEATGVKNLDDLFKTVFLSYEMGLMKPDHEIYLKVLSLAGIEPQDTLFLDDNLANIQAASQLGIHTIHVQKPTTILEYLSSYV